MNNKKPFGSIKAKALNPGDLVKWSKWNHEKSMWEKKYGLIIRVVNEIRSNRLVSISHVYVYEKKNVKEFFTLSLKKVKSHEKQD
jgi:hypothetical protein|tara:strand:+ start:2528 stop:2782 length:255 start_codon:yes stop_codon:yes gene_type:complete